MLPTYRRIDEQLWPSMLTPFRRLAVGGVAIPWYLTTGIVAGDVVCAYKPKGAASLAASYVNLANPGTNDAAPGVAPTFNAATGWTFNGSTQYLTTGDIALSEGMSILLRYSGLTDAIGAPYGFDGNQLEVGGFYVYQLRTTIISFTLGYSLYVQYEASIPVSGVVACSIDGIYLNGSLVAPASSPPSVSGTYPIYIGASYGGSTPNWLWTGNNLAFAIYNKTLNATQMAAISTAMAAL